MPLPPPLPPYAPGPGIESGCSNTPPPPMVSDAFDGLDETRRLYTLRYSEPFQPCHMFFYGSLRDPEVLQAVLDLSELPITRPATISGFEIKMWGIYPALVPSTASEKVLGSVWELTSEDHFDRLAAYETAAYRWIECDAVLEDADGATLQRCRMFCWAGEPDSKELEDGTFDLERYQKYFKPSVTRKRSPAP